MPRAKPTARSERHADVAIHQGALRLAVVADTHGAPHPNTLALLRERAPDAILHAGDIGDLAVLGALGAIAPTLAVRGNIDAATNDLPDELTIDLREPARGQSVFRILLVHIAVFGPRLRADVARRARARGAGLVVCGHSHVPFVGRDQGVGVFNPGSVGPRRDHLPIVFGLLEIAGGKLALTHVDCETGAPWLPP